jgi:hypothetical protein
MSLLIYGGLKYLQSRHAVYCKLCKETVESKSNYDFKMCSCNSVGVDGGIGYGNRIIGSIENMEQRSIYCTYVNGKRLWLPPDVIETAHLNRIEKYKQNAREVKSGASYGNSDLVKEVTEGRGSS